MVLLSSSYCWHDWYVYDSSLGIYKLETILFLASARPLSCPCCPAGGD